MGASLSLESGLDSRTCDKRSSESTDVDLDWNGCRKFGRLPPSGQHPRLFFTKEELPRIVRRFFHSEISGYLRTILDVVRKTFLKDIDGPMSRLSPEDIANPRSKEIVDQFFTANEHRGVNILGTYVSGLLFDDPKLTKRAVHAALFYARIILRSRNIALEGAGVTEKPYDVWHSTGWDLRTGWLLGGSSFALMYDLVYNDISPSDRDVMREAIATAVYGRRSWGMGWPCRRIQSNWAAYHGDLYTMAAVVEGEKGFDEGILSQFSDLMVHYLDYAFYDSGHPVEDCYALNLGLREGSICFLAMARRGLNLFNHPHYKKIWTDWMPYALEPGRNGLVYGGSSGSSFIYPTSAIVAKYAFPKDPIIDYVYRQYMCESGKSLSRMLKLQSRLAAIALAIPAFSANGDNTETSAVLNLPLNFICRDRGKVVMRSDWTENALWFILDARPDGFLIGHDTCSRGAFVLNASGRAWGFCPEWKYFTASSDYSLPSIDKCGQSSKAPFVKMQEFLHEGNGSTYVSADLTYAYNWTWTTWARATQNFESLGYEKEPNDPRDFGFNVWWAPSKLHGEKDVAFAGLHQWRKRISMVDEVFRSSLFVRGGQPFVIVADDLRKDGDVHDYSWAMTTPNDVELLSFSDGDALLQEKGSLKRRLLVRNLCHKETNLDCAFRRIEKQRQSVKLEDEPCQLIFTGRFEHARFRFLLFPLPNATCQPPDTQWVKDGTVLSLRNRQTAETQDISFQSVPHGACSIRLLRHENISKFAI